ncbi:hypothetical protein [Francisella marina]|uniref:Chitin-binding type-3 domain-containing protein n=1 Tax=Francisella marina TaxID=2249302 RepID=A0ABX5ZH66_9GAMM|nr:hypothetical protein [Francisella marina]QEO57796.1 hypothetical protein F0R74_07985 [Francisella marina]QEO59977.1 hypothetical protein F0R75_09330 [Francisella marina]
MKKTSLVVVALFTSTLALATPFTLNIDNQSEAQGLQLHSSTDGDKNLEKGINTFNLDTQNQYEIRIPNVQIIGSLKQDASFFTMQSVPMNPQYYQNLNVEISSPNGSYKTVTPKQANGICSIDTQGQGITCRVSKVAPSELNITLTGGKAPEPIAEYTYDAGVWDGSKIYQVKYNPTLYPKVIYSVDGGKNYMSYVACWYADASNTPGNGDPWREYDPSKNVCS